MEKVKAWLDKGTACIELDGTVPKALSYWKEKGN